MRAVCTLPLVVAVLSRLVAGQASSQSSFIEQKDRDLASKADKKAAKECKDVKPMEVAGRDDAKKSLLSASGDNFLLKVLKKSKGRSEIQSNLIKEAQDPAFATRTSGPLVGVIVMLVIYLLCCCWTCCPCCKCCRCCKGQHEPSLVFKFAFVLAVAGICVGVVVAGSWGAVGMGQAADGFGRLGCTSAKMVNTTLSGETDPHFLGLIPILEKFNNILSTLDDGSPFITDLKQVLLNTQVITDAVKLATVTMGNLNTMMSNSANNRPKTSAGVDLLHECSLCTKLSQPLSQAISVLGSSVGAALDSARSEVDKQLSGDGLVSLRTSMNQASTPLVDLKSSVHSMFGPFVETDFVPMVAQAMAGPGVYSVVGFVALAALIILCAVCSIIPWILCSDEPGAKLHRCAACSWCCGCWYIWLALFVGGIMTLISVPIASLCLILDDLNGQMLTDIGTALEQNFTGAQGSMVVDMIDQCFANPDPKANPKLLDIITITENGTTVTLNTRIVGQVKDQINGSFSQITESQQMGSVSLAKDPNIVQLLEIIQNNSMDKMMLPLSSHKWDQDAKYKEMALDTTGNPKLIEYLVSSCACADHVVDSKSIYGLQSFTTSLSAFGVQQPSVGASCARKVICTDQATNPSAPNYQRSRACIAGNNFMGLKQDVLQANTFKCVEFKLDDGSRCNILGMRENPPGSGKYTGDCRKNDGTWEPIEYACTLAAFTTLVDGYAGQMRLAFQRMDSATAASLTKIEVDLRNLVNKYIISEIEAVANGVTCGFLGSFASFDSQIVSGHHRRHVLRGSAGRDRYFLLVRGYGYPLCIPDRAHVCPLAYRCRQLQRQNRKQ
eukprot:TRINITY_DN11852_c0_g1_i1.p1 TRINITY_DN11852_c0_g1~~TRINITY_DN11852_c0_g1_i1.p1  ORF type:complete len:855 (-),score=136.74 TRINITY_DN11852_c0_g1_i1:133-2652(-)